MSTLLLNMNAPIQSWGMDSPFEVRNTLRHPTKSAIIGMIACALGWDRNHDLSRLRALKFGVRVDSEGTLHRDYHTVSLHPDRDSRTPKTQWNKAPGAKTVTKQSYRWYILNAESRIGIESDDSDFLGTIEHALKSPAYVLFCGRKSCPAPLGMVMGIIEESLSDALWLDANQLSRHGIELHNEMNSFRSASRKPNPMYVLVENKSGKLKINDTPLSFSMTDREYSSTQYSKTLSSDKEHDAFEDMFDNHDEHDPMFFADDKEKDQ